MRSNVNLYYLRRIRGNECQMYYDRHTIYREGFWADCPSNNLPLLLPYYEMEFRMTGEKRMDPSWEYEINEYLD